MLTGWGKRNPVYASMLFWEKAGVVAGASVPIAVRFE